MVINKISEVSQRLDWIRRQKGFNQEELARALGISQPAVSKYLKDRLPPADVLLKLAQLGQTTVEWILTGQKSYLYDENGKPPEVRESGQNYDADLQLVHKIARLPATTREALMLLVERLS